MKPTSNIIIDQLTAQNALTDTEIKALPTSEIFAFLSVVGGIAGAPNVADPNYATVNTAYTRLAAELDARIFAPTGFVFGNDNVGSDAGIRFLDPGYGNNSTSPTTAISIIAPRGGKLRNLFVRHHATTTSANSVTYTVQVNGIDTTLTVTLAANAVATVSNVSNVIVVAQGDRITVKVAKSGAIGAGNLKAVASMEIA